MTLSTYVFPSLILKDKFKFHDEIKDNLLKLINESKGDKWENKDDYFNDKLLKTDWPDASNKDRKWVQKYENHLSEQLLFFANYLGYQKIDIQKLWFQQYSKQDTHGWHIHGANYTGAYYLEMPSDAPTTEFLFTDNLDKSFTIKVEEGDIIFFPCYFIHRSNKSISSNTKTIISWNLDFIDILPKYVGDKKEILICS
jgi:hypothetical protein